MPELPDVEGFRRTFARHAVGKPVRAVFLDPGQARNTRPSALGQALKGRSFSDPRRHGKYLLCPAGGPVLVLHFGMTGGLRWQGGDAPRHPHDRLAISFDDGKLVLRDLRKLGGVWLARDEDGLAAILEGLGPDVLEVGRREFAERVSSRRGSLKSTLMDQSVLAGLGNLTVDESLWRARLAPRRSAGSLDSGELTRLHRSVRGVLGASVRAGRVPDRRGWLTPVRGKQGRCPRCGGALARDTIAGRTTYWCRSCQG